MKKQHTLKAVSREEIYLDGELLTPEESQKYHNHSPDGFNWGYGGSGPAQLALAIFLKIRRSPNGYQEFKWDHLSKLEPGKPFELRFFL